MTALDEPQRQQLRARLAQRQAELLRELGQFQRDRLDVAAQESAHEVVDQAEVAERREREDVGEAEATRDHDELVAVRAALARMDDGSYGECIDCGVDIGFARLSAQPAAARCLPCQEQAERR
jgi:RNA polymerase-binding protein DksA